jgi:hypothetical protein
MEPLTMIDELKPCQCGEQTPEFTTYKHSVYGDRYGVTCYTCGLFLDCRKKTKDEAAKIWNTRPRGGALQADVQQLTTENGNLKHLVANLRQQLYFKNLPTV